MRRMFSLMLATFLAPLPRIAAQQAGDRVRLTMESASQRLSGTLVGQDTDSFCVQIPGAALGYAVRTDRWQGVPLSRAHQLALAPRGPGLALSLTF